MEKLMISVHGTPDDRIVEHLNMERGTRKTRLWKGLLPD